MIGQMIWRNIWRNRRRTWITISSIALTVALAVFMRSLQVGIFNHLIKNVVSYYSGYIQVHKAGYQEENILDNGFMASDSALNPLRQIPGVEGWIPRLETFMLLSDGNTTKGCLIVGIMPEQEEALTAFSTKIIRGQFWDTSGNELVLAEKLAEKFKVDVGDTVFILGQGYRESFAAAKLRVSGIIRFGSPELNASLCLMPLPALRTVLNAEDLLTAYVADLRNPADMETIQQGLIRELPPSYEVLSWKEMMPDIENHLKADTRGYYIIMGMLYLIILFGLFGTIFMGTQERKYEVSVLLAIGMKKRWLAAIMLGETLLFAWVGALLGMLISIPLVLYFQVHPIRLGGAVAEAYASYGFEPVMPTIMNMGLVWDQTIWVCLMALVTGLYPITYVYRFREVGKIRM